MNVTVVVAIASVFILDRAYGASVGEGAGANSCAQFAEDYALSPKTMEPLYFEWAEGFMAGLNLQKYARHEAEREFDTTSLDEQQATIRSYCNDHPLADYVQAVVVLYNSLPIEKALKH